MDKEDVERIVQLLIEIRDTLCTMEARMNDVICARESIAVREQSRR